MSGDGGEITFARLAWPGYSATIDGTATQADSGWHGLLRVNVPPGDHELTISFAPRVSGCPSQPSDSQRSWHS